MAKILIIDDDDQLRISFSKLLTEGHYDVVSAASGKAGIEIVKITPLDLVIPDVHLPGMNGLETFKEIKK
ncbi:response regulator [Desulfobacter vibrioformis]|uniref:response regulator n=1 Tax=Desulfobacter vibrioformis TaxID=34031 RepID=UPI000554AC65|nr:response regulator [Desulfobacter vibrioformis]